MCDYPWIEDLYASYRASTPVYRRCYIDGYPDELSAVDLCHLHRSSYYTRIFQCVHCRQWMRSEYNWTQGGYCRDCEANLFPPQNRWGEHCKLEKCEGCGRMGNPQRITYRAGMAVSSRKDRYKNLFPTRLCMACWNRYRPLANKYLQLEQCRKLLNRVICEYREKNRSLNGRTSRPVV